MGIKIVTDRTLLLRDDRIHKELQTDINSKDLQISALKAKITDLSQRLDMAHEVEVNQATVIATQKKEIAAQAKDIIALMEHKRELEAQEEYFRGQITALQETSVKLANENSMLKHDAASYDAASDGFVQQIKDLHREIFHLLAFLRSLHKGDFRSNRNGPKRYDEAQELLKQYDTVDDKKVIGK